MSGSQLHFEDVQVGDTIPQLKKGPMTVMHLMRWSAAIENFHRIHYDLRYTMEHDKLADVAVQGSWKQQVLVQLLKDWAGAGGWLWKLNFQFRKPDYPGQALTAWGKVTNRTVKDDLGYIDLEVGIRNDERQEGTPGAATVVLPLRGGRPVPYPFVAPRD